MTPLPKHAGDFDRVDLKVIQQNEFIMGAMDFLMMQLTQGDDKFVADFYAHRSRLRKRDVMGIRRPPCAFQTELVGHIFGGHFNQLLAAPVCKVYFPDRASPSVETACPKTFRRWCSTAGRAGSCENCQ